MKQAWSCIAAFSLTLASAQLQAEDAEGCKDHPLFNRMTGYQINGCEARDFDARDFPAGDVDENHVPKKVMGVEGVYNEIVYQVSDGARSASALQILRNFQNAVKSAGGETLKEYGPGDSASALLDSKFNGSTMDHAATLRLLKGGIMVVAATMTTCHFIGEVTEQVKGDSAGAAPVSATPETSGDAVALASSVTAFMADTRIVKADYSDYFEMVVTLTNNSQKPISGFKGQIEIFNLFDKPLLTSGFEDFDTIAPGKSIQSKQELRINQFLSSHQDIVAAAASGKDRLKFRVTPKAVVFADGTKLGQ